MNINGFIKRIDNEPELVEFEHTMDIIEQYFEFTPSAFRNGDIQNEANQNNGSCKIFAFGAALNLNEQQTLTCFGRFYREDVLQHPTNDDHQNIRNFMRLGWKGIGFDNEALVKKS